MEYNRLGKAGIKVSELGLGSSMFTFVCQQDNLLSIKECARAAWDAGANFFDTAERYGMGLSELVLGEVLRDFRRDEMVVCTKLFVGGVRPNQKGLSRKHLREGLENSLRRLRLDYVDLLYCHRYDPGTPMDEVVQAMDEIVRAGYAFYWGTSEWTREQIEEAHAVARLLGCIPPSMEESEYNLFVRDRIEVEYLPLYERYGMGLVAYGPLAGGVLTGKHNDRVAPGTRVDRYYDMLKEEYLPEERLARARDLSLLAEDLECTPAQLSLAWCLKNPNVSTVLAGATSKRQIEENIGALEVKEKLTEDLMERLDEMMLDRLLEPEAEEQVPQPV